MEISIWIWLKMNLFPREVNRAVFPAVTLSWFNLLISRISGYGAAYLEQSLTLHMNCSWLCEGSWSSQYEGEQAYFSLKGDLRP